jgi:hypothetical protein
MRALVELYPDLGFQITKFTGVHFFSLSLLFFFFFLLFFCSVFFVFIRSFCLFLFFFYFLLLFTFFSFVTFMFSGYYKNFKNRRTFFENFANSQGFDPLEPNNWYSFKQNDFSHLSVCYFISFNVCEFIIHLLRTNLLI